MNLGPPPAFVSATRETLLLCAHALPNNKGTNKCNRKQNNIGAIGVSTYPTSANSVCVSATRFDTPHGAHAADNSTTDTPTYLPGEQMLSLSYDPPSKRETENGARGVIHACTGASALKLNDLYWTHVCVTDTNADTNANTNTDAHMEASAHENNGNDIVDTRRGVFTVVRPDVTLQASPVPRVPVFVNALARRITSVCGIDSHVSECGLLTMDATRKAVLMHAQDPAQATRPIIGA